MQELNEHVREMEAKQLLMPDFPSGLEWFNSAPLSFQGNLKGKIVVLDFWTYCCINCIHVLPDLAALEEKYADDPVVFIGVHSAKFDNEKDSENIRRAILRYEITHPVVNDPEMTLWRHIGVHSWPTFVVIGPSGHIIFSVSGEGQRETLDAMISTLLDYYPKESFDRTPPPIDLERDRLPQDLTLSFPGKLAVDPEGKRLFLSDSNHNRILITNLEGKVVDSIGKGIPGLVDGNFRNAQFFRLQGLAYYKDMLYVADTENHALRCVDLVEKQVTTLAGNGTQGRDYRGGGKGKEQALSTPWDVVINKEGDRLYIAMAGTHQIWTYEIPSGRTYSFSGSGAEQNLNSNSLMSAAWAQPSGLSLSEHFLYVADSESSSLRAIDLVKKRTETLAGGDFQHPGNLFCFGVQDGDWRQARFQHPLGVLWLDKEGVVLVADTYNHKIRAYDPRTKQVSTWAGSGTPGNQDGVGTSAGFYEPSGLALAPGGNEVFIADTNNHRIRVLDVGTKKVTTLKM